MKSIRQMELLSDEKRRSCDVCDRPIYTGAEIVQSAVGVYNGAYRTPFWDWRRSYNTHLTCYREPFLRQSAPYHCIKCQGLIKSGEYIYYRKQGLMTPPSTVHAEFRLPSTIYLAHYDCLFGVSSGDKSGVVGSDNRPSIR